MTSSDLTSGPIRDLTHKELGISAFSDFELLSDRGHNLIYRALCDGRWVVLKFARVEEGNTTRNLLLLHREYDIMRAIDSIYVVHPWQITEVPDIGTAIVMEYVNGRTLDAFLQEKPSYSERKRLAEEMMEALISLHERQIVHGDLKGSNILITNTGNHVRLIDFGFSDTDAYVAKNIGSAPSVRPPQSPSSDDIADVQRDIYAFGKILSLLFPHQFRLIRKRCLHGNYPSIREVRKALHRHMRCLWLIPPVGIILAIVIAVFSWPRNELQEPVFTQPYHDTIVVITPPTDSVSPPTKDSVVIVKPVAVAKPVDSKWITIQKKAEGEYNTLYQVYADSLKNMSEPEMIAASEIRHRYVVRMLEVRDKYIATYPEYTEQLSAQETSIYSHDYTQLCNIHKDYPIIIRK